MATGDRSQIYNFKYVVSRIAQSLGPLLSLFVVIYLGNEWRLDVLRPVLSVGLPFLHAFVGVVDLVVGLI